MYRPRRCETSVPIGQRTRGCSFSVSGDLDRGATVTVDGDLDVMTADVLPAVVRALLTAGTQSIRLDASRLRSCDDAGLRSVVAAYNDVLYVRGLLHLVGVRPQLVQLLTSSGLAGTVPLSVEPDGSAAGAADVLAAEVAAFLASRATDAE